MMLMKRQVRELKATKKPIAYASGLLFDGERAFFLQKKTFDGKIELELPGGIVMEGESPVSIVKAALAQKAGIDCEVGTVQIEGRFNAGSRKHRQLVPALGLDCKAKDKTAHPSSEYCGIKWVKKDEVRRERLARNSEWILARN